MDRTSFSKLLDKNKKDGVTCGFMLSLRLYRKLKALIRKVEKQTVNPQINDAENISLWIKENFSRVEEGVRNSIKNVRKLKRIEAHNKAPRIFTVFECYFKENCRIDTKGLCGLFEVLNICGNIDISNAGAALPLAEAAAYDRIMNLFAMAYDEIPAEKELLGRIEDMFETLDSFSFVSREDLFRDNAVEKILVSDPANVYEKLSDDTKNSYRNNLVRLSVKYKLSEAETAEKTVASCLRAKGHERHIGHVLCDKPGGGKTYIFLTVFLTVLFVVLLCIISPLMIITAVPVYGCVRMLLDKFFVRYFVRDFHLPRLELAEIPDKCGVIAVVTTLLTGGDSDLRLVNELEKMYFSNGGKNVYFGLLADLPDSDSQTDDKDMQIVTAVNEEILKLRKKYGDIFFLFIRDRKYSRSEGKYIAPERKRGAVSALTKYLCGKSDCFSQTSIKPCEDICCNIKYVFTLDSDTNLAFDCIRHMAGIMLHPQNVPVCDKKAAVVTKGYGILQPSVSPSVEASSKTYFSKIMCGHGGVDVYSSGGTDILMRLFGKSVFCGKGMFDKNCFYETLCGENEFEKSRILSHDAPEGARLRCAYVSDVTLTDSFPKEELSYYKRKHRWIRGDVQNFEFLLPYVKNASGRRIKNNIGIFSKLMIFDNIFEAVKPIFVLLISFVSVLCEETLGILMITAAFSVYILPFLYSVLYLPKRSLWHNFRRVYSSDGLYTGLWTNFMLMLFRICSVPKSACVSADAVVRSIYRMTVSGKKTLEWMTAAQSDAESGDGLLGYVKKNLFSAFCGCVIFVMSPNGFLKLVSLMWLFLPLFSFRTGIVKDRKRYISEDDRNTLMRYLEDMWKYFCDSTGKLTNNLPPDNMAVFPQRKISRMTSPTNIGFYLLSAAIAAKSGIEDVRTSLAYISACVDTIEALPKYKGLLYNWYDVFEAKPMTPLYVSSVDLGNYVSCLLCTRAAIKELSGDDSSSETLMNRIEKLIDECDLSLLFDYRAGLFFIGGELRDGSLVFDKNRYDMLMSEARLTGYISVARRTVPYEHLAKLSRRTVEGGGYMGYASWSGTAFEYFLPELFIRSPHGTMMYEAVSFCYRMQKKAAVNTPYGKVFGISESCYNEMDAYSNYKYKAFGVGALSVNVTDYQRVISPYSSFLFMPMSTGENLRNLGRLERLGMYGEYGFYESADFERKAASEICSHVRCFMSHHVGMSMAATANVLFDNAVSKWFSDDVRFRNASEFVKEKIPYNAYVKGIHRKNRASKPAESRNKLQTNNCNYARLALESLVLYARRDRLSVKAGESQLFVSGTFPESFRNIRIGLEIGDKNVVLGKNASLSSDAGKIVFSERIATSGSEIFDISISATMHSDISEVVRMKLRLRQLSGEVNNALRVSFMFKPLLDKKKNAYKCSYFEEKSNFYTIRPDGFCAFENRSTGFFLYSGITHGRKAETTVRDGIVMHMCDAVKNDSVYECCLAFSLSANEKCAWTGLARVNETDFECAAKELAGRSTVIKRGRRDNSLVMRKKSVMGDTPNREEAPAFPEDIAKQRAFLLSGKELSCIIYKDGLGFSFCKNANKGRVSEYNPGVHSFAERLVFLNDGYDLCKNSISFECNDGIAVYSGKYKNKDYRVEVFIPENDGVKVVKVVTDSSESAAFIVMPTALKFANIQTGGGFTSFSNEMGTGFVYGYADKKTDACYDVEDEVTVKISADTNVGSGRREYVFAIGYTQKRMQAEQIVFRIRNELALLEEEARNLSHELYYDLSLADDSVKGILDKMFGISESGVCYTQLVDVSCGLNAVNMVLLAYTKGKFFVRQFFDFLKHADGYSTSSRMLCVLGFCEYVRINKRFDLADEMLSGKTVYRHLLAIVFEICDKKRSSREFADLRRNVLLKMSELCSILRDERSAERLKDAAHDAENKQDGIFL